MNPLPEFEASVESLSLDGRFKYTVQLGFSEDKKSVESLIFNSDPFHYVHITGIPDAKARSFVGSLADNPCEISEIERAYDQKEITFDEFMHSRGNLEESDKRLELGKDITPGFEPFITIESSADNKAYLISQRERIDDYLRLLGYLEIKFDENAAVTEWVNTNCQIFRAEHPNRITLYDLYSQSTFGDIRFCSHDKNHLWNMFGQYVRKFYFVDSKLSAEETRECLNELDEKIGESCPECDRHEALILT